MHGKSSDGLYGQSSAPDALDVERAALGRDRAAHDGHAHLPGGLAHVVCRRHAAQTTSPSLSRALATPLGTTSRGMGPRVPAAKPPAYDAPVRSPLSSLRGAPSDAELWHDPGTHSRFWYWARDAWWEIVKSGDPHHRRRGVHIRPCFYGAYENDKRDAKRVGDYFWRESGKLGQKVAPKGFPGVKWWDVWGIDPIETRSEVSVTESSRCAGCSVENGTTWPE